MLFSGEIIIPRTAHRLFGVRVCISQTRTVPPERFTHSRSIGAAAVVPAAGSGEYLSAGQYSLFEPDDRSDMSSVMGYAPVL